MTKNQLKFLTIALILGNIMSGLDSTIINTAIPSIVANLHGIQFMGWISCLECQFRSLCGQRLLSE